MVMYLQNTHVFIILRKSCIGFVNTPELWHTPRAYHDSGV